VINELLRNLSDGNSVEFTDDFETPAGLLDLARRPGTYFALGRTGVRSDGDFTARRKGDLITMEGEVRHRLDSRPEAENKRGLVGDPYDFKFPQPGSVTAGVLALGPSTPIRDDLRASPASEGTRPHRARRPAYGRARPLGRDPMNSGWRRGVVRRAKAGTGSLALFLVGLIVPLWPWWLIYGGKLIRRALGLGASPTVGWRPKALRWAKAGAALLTLFIFFSIVPVWPWWPTCGGKLITGDYRDIYVDGFANALTRDNVYYWRSGDLVLVRVLPWLDGDEYWGQEAVILNGERKLAEALSDDQTIDGVFYPAPEAVMRLKKELEPIIGPDPRLRPDGRWCTAATRGSRAIASCSAPRSSSPSPEPSGPRGGPDSRRVAAFAAAGLAIG
jgi:hypothetical protein